MYQYHPLSGWILHRLRRILPFLALAFVLCLCWYKLQKQPSRHHYYRPVHPETEMKHHTIPEPPVELCTKWLIVEENPVSVPDTCTQAVATLTDWNVIVIHHKPKPKYRHSRCTYIHHINNEKSLAHNAWTKALYHSTDAGATVISTVKDSSQLHDLQTLILEPGSSHLVYEKTSPGCSNFLHTMTTNPVLKFYEGLTPAVQGFVTQPGLICDARAPGLTLSDGLYADIASKPIVYHQQAFWAFFLTIPQFNKAKSVLVSFVQTLLWLSGNNLFVRSNSKYFDPEYDKINMLDIEQELCSWKCNSDDFSKCFLQLAKEFQKRDFFSQEIYDFLKDWMHILPTRTQLIPKVSTSLNSGFKQTVINITSLTFQCSKDISNNQYEATDKLLRDTCTNHQELKKIVSQPWIQFDDILLIVVFNKPHFEALPYLELLYARFFPYMIYCGPEIPHLPVEYEYSYITYESSSEGHWPGAFNYKCASVAMQLGYNVSGYLFMGDDVLLSLYKIAHYDRHVTWYLPKEELRTADVLTGRECRLGSCDSSAHWRWWEDYRSELLTALAEIEQLATESFTFHKCYSQLVRLNGGPKRANGGYADLYYIPERLSKAFVELSQVFLHRNVFLELAVPTIIRCLENPDDIKPLSGFQDLFESRDKPWENFEKIRGKAYIHPSKLGPIATNSLQHKFFFCHNVLPFIYDQYGRVRLGNSYLWNQDM